MVAFEKIPLSSLLWRTRGLGWDYAFIRLPERVPLGGWYRAYQAVLSASLLVEGRGGMLRSVIGLSDGDGHQLRLALAVFIDKRCDSSSRPIRHTFGYVLPEDAAEEHTVCEKWPDAVWSVLNEVFEPAYRLDHQPDDVEELVRDDLSIALRTLSPDRVISVPRMPQLSLPLVQIGMAPGTDGYHPSRRTFPSGVGVSNSRLTRSTTALVAVACALTLIAIACFTALITSRDETPAKTIPPNTSTSRSQADHD